MEQIEPNTDLSSLTKEELINHLKKMETDRDELIEKISISAR